MQPPLPHRHGAPLHHRAEGILLQKTRQFGEDMTVERKFDAKSMLGMLRRYEATVGDLFAVVPPLMSRDSVKAADIDGVTLGASQRKT